MGRPVNPHREKIIECLRNGESCRELSTKFGIHPGVISRWQKEFVTVPSATSNAARKKANREPREPIEVETTESELNQPIYTKPPWQRKDVRGGLTEEQWRAGSDRLRYARVEAALIALDDYNDITASIAELERLGQKTDANFARYARIKSIYIINRAFESLGLPGIPSDMVAKDETPIIADISAALIIRQQNRINSNPTPNPEPNPNDKTNT